MKKILLVLMLIFLGHNAFAMYCWEEYSGKFNYDSKMTSKLGANNIVKVSSILTAVSSIYYNCAPRETGTYYSQYGTEYQNSCTKISETGQIKLHGNNFPDYLDEYTITNADTSGIAVSLPSIKGANLFVYWKSGKYSTVEQDYVAKIYDQKYYTKGYGESRLYNANYFFANVIRLLNPYYTHTFCTTVGGGGGGGAAGAAVNYIIKAD